MLTTIFLMIVDAVISLLSITLLLRFYMQWMRVSFRNQIGGFVTQLTNWLVLPLRRFVPSLGGLDLSSLVPAVILQAIEIAVVLWLRGSPIGIDPVRLAAIVLAVGVLEVIRLSVWLLIIIVIMSAVLSWISPYSPISPILNNLARPFLRPFQKIIPPIANIDLSPLVLLLILQIVLMVIGQVRLSLLPVLM
ncbi:MAG TPA: YggT family protein [Rhodocyclaceae bacterium]|nr:YggT family protein [Rhodocyclaceae bacterium]HNB77739.1 YggT family protein [Rhodocyclaceae bacterium]HNC60452.1 YggT family protein [Rhodocyclaceae bacterium]HNH11801.1 YggT family protein [Rhodocyclaceae bacterium]